MKEFTHLDKNDLPSMVSVGEKETTKREATAVGKITLTQKIVDLFNDGELSTKKGPVLQTAIIAGTMAVKKTSELIPFCHPLMIEKCKFQMELSDLDLNISCTVGISGKTGVEMEALTGVSTAALTVYDMCKALSHEMVIGEIKLQRKSGGKSDFKDNG